VRIPAWVISPWAKPGHLEPAVHDLTSILKFIERVFGLPTLASVNHRFDAGRRSGANYLAAAPGRVGGTAGAAAGRALGHRRPAGLLHVLVQGRPGIVCEVVTHR
jgi:hypothetical protein